MRITFSICVLLLLGGTAAAAPPLLVSGDAVVSNVFVEADVDEFLLQGTAGGSFSVDVKALDDGLAPFLRLFAPSGAEVDLSPWSMPGPGSASLVKVEFDENGLYRLEVSGGGTTAGPFSLAYKAKGAKGRKAKGETLSPGASRTYRFAAAVGGTVKLAVKFRTPAAPPALVEFVDAKGSSRAGEVVAGPKGLKAAFAATGTFGEWRLTLRNDGLRDAVFDVSIASKLPKAKKSSRTFPDVAVRQVLDVLGTRAPVTFDVWDPERRAVTVRFSFSLDGGVDWADCRPVTGGQNPMVVEGGTSGHEFPWDILAQVSQDLGVSCAHLPDVRVRAEVVAPEGDGDEFHPVSGPLELWAYPEPSREAVREDLHTDLGADGVLDSLVLVDTRAETDFEVKHLPGAVSYGPPHSFALDDFDGDQVPDLVTAEPGGTSVMFHAGKGDGTFAASRAAGPGQRPSLLATGDLDGDGAPDIVHANRSSTYLTVLLGKGDGTFAAPVRFDAGRAARDLLIADLDGNAVRDLLLLGEDVAFFPGLGDGTFGGVLTSPCGHDPAAFALGLLDGDLLPDLAVVNRRTAVPAAGPDVSFLRGNGNGSFGGPTAHPVGEDPSGLAIADFDLDGAPDLAVLNRGSGSISILWNQGGADFLSGTSIDGGNRPTSLAVAEMTGDGRPDLVVTNLEATAPGADTPSAAALVKALSGRGFGEPALFPTGRDPVRLLAGDLDGDQNTDLVVATSGADNRTVLLGSGAGDFARVEPDLNRRFVFYCYGLG
ncbi:MAG: VCBS repeat-containing protein [Planctomycetes bacterium]|jgi:hypothetical protein|nr:VCBS repeat-containing protein [Planctomycetota bacterium]